MEYDYERYDMWAKIQELINELSVKIIVMNADLPQDVITYVKMVQDELMIQTVENLLERQEVLLMDIGEEE